MSQTKKALREALDEIALRFVSGNKIQIDSARISRSEWLLLQAALSLPETQGEPVAWRFMVDGTWFVGATLEICTKNLEGVVPMSKPEPLFAAPAAPTQAKPTNGEGA